jgi:hypothetical protein
VTLFEKQLIGGAAAVALIVLYNYARWRRNRHQRHLIIVAGSTSEENRPMRKMHLTDTQQQSLRLKETDAKGQPINSGAPAEFKIDNENVASFLPDADGRGGKIVAGTPGLTHLAISCDGLEEIIEIEVTNGKAENLEVDLGTVEEATATPPTATGSGSPAPDGVLVEGVGVVSTTTTTQPPAVETSAASTTDTAADPGTTSTAPATDSTGTGTPADPSTPQ